MEKKNEHVCTGHRKRLRSRFLNSGFEGFLDYEIVELLLTLGTPRRDCKQQAKEAIQKFGGLTRVLDASMDSLQTVKGIGPSNAFGLKLFQAVSERYAQEKLTEEIFLHSPQSAYEYLKEKIGKKDREHFTILCLGTKNNILMEDVSVGTLNSSVVHPREVFKKAILNSASHVILSHNHPSGDPTPSQEDILTTRRLVDAGKLLGIAVSDHIVVSSRNYVSMREEKLINF